MLPARPAVPLLGLLLGPLLLAGCLGGDDADVLTTFYPLHFLATELAGDNITVSLLIPEGTEPHDWEPSPRDVRRLDGATLLVAQGLGFEPWLHDVTHALGGSAPTVIESAEGLIEEDEETADEPEQAADDEHGHDHGDVDPHTWLDPVLFTQQAEHVLEGLIAGFPAHEATLRSNSEALLADLAALEAEYAARLASCSQRLIVTQHDAFARLAARYGFEVESLAGVDPEAEPAARRVQELINIVREKQLTVVFTESGADARIMRSIADETGAELRELHTLEGRSRAEREARRDYLDLMRENLDGLAVAMECRA